MAPCLVDTFGHKGYRNRTRPQSEPNFHVLEPSLSQVIALGHPPHQPNDDKRERHQTETHQVNDKSRSNNRVHLIYENSEPAGYENEETLKEGPHSTQFLAMLTINSCDGLSLQGHDGGKRDFRRSAFHRRCSIYLHSTSKMIWVEDSSCWQLECVHPHG